MGNDEATKIIGIVGRRMMGKTFLARKFLNAPQSRRVLVYDTNYEFNEFIQVNTRENLIKVCKSSPSFKVSFRPKDKVGDLQFFCDVVRWKGNVLVLFDEAHWLMSAKGCPRSLIDLVGISRHLGIHVIFSTQRLDTLNNDIYDNFSDLFVFQVINQDDIKFLQKYSPGKDLSYLMKLPVGEYYHLAL